jgi:hypothetical protein
MTESADPRAEYERRLGVWRARIGALDRGHLRISNGRLIVALAAAVSLWLAVFRGFSSLWPIATVIAFLSLIVAHARLLQRLDRARRAERLYLRGLDRLTGRWMGGGRDGAAFLDDHPYARDLDLFGRASLFELLNTARTEAGEHALAGWLRAGAAPAEVLARQAAVDELRGLIDFREDVAVLAAETEVSRTSGLALWASSKGERFTSLAVGVFGVCAIGMAALLGLVYADVLPGRVLGFWLLLESVLSLAWRRPIQRVLSGVATPDRDLSLLADLLARVESQPFASVRLAALKARLFTHGVPPSRRVAQLRRMVSWLDSARNQMFAPIAYALALPQCLAVAIDRWHDAYGGAVVEWLDAIGELEALSALGTYAFEWPADPFPTIATGEEPVFDANGLGHPLMAGDASVRNDVHLGVGGPRVLVISGSNMSGKSTLLRSVGVNVVLALAGGPVRALRLRLSPLAIGATLRVEDSLQAGHSRFYAEILRIRAIVETARGPAPLMFLLDEILHGTNSFDRRIGAEAIVRSLAGLGAIGLVTTHDLALTELPARLGAVAGNMHFEDRLENGQMVFDYRMRPGVVEHSNALALMRAIGLDV